MLLEDLLVLVLGAVVAGFIVPPGWRLYRRIVPAKRNPVREAKERLEAARLEAEAARLNKETEHIVEELYNEEVNEDPHQKEHVK
jgi:hypothetical protein